MLKIGEKIPDISLPDQNGNSTSLKSFEGRKPLVVYFYPKDNTPGCTVEACSFRDNYQDFVKLGAEVIGISGDSITSHKKVVEKRKLPFLLLSDNNREAEKAFGVQRNLFGLLPGRVTFVTDKNNIVIDIFSSSTRPSMHVAKALGSLKKAQV